MERPDTIVNRDELDWIERENGDAFALSWKQLADDAGGKHLGCTLYRLPPGQRAHPYHFHYANEEALYVLAGEGLLRCPDGHVVLRRGDYCVLPKGDAGAHQVINTTEDPLEYLAMSTRRDPEIVYYPDSDKYLLGAKEDPSIWRLVPGDVELDYWDGESRDDLPPIPDHDEP